MEFRILGPVEVRDGGVEIPLDGVKPRTVLAALLLARGNFLADAELRAVLWADNAPATLSAQIYNYVSRLRKALGPDTPVVRRAPGYQLRAGAASFDFAEFETLAARGQTALHTDRYEEARRLLRGALDLWRGPALADVADPLAEVEGPRIEEARIGAVEALVEAELATGRHADVLPELTRLVQQFPLRERFRAQLMTTLYRCGRQAEALDLYERSRRMLDDELGVQPGADLRAVHHAILTADSSVLHRPGLPAFRR